MIAPWLWLVLCTLPFLALSYRALRQYRGLPALTQEIPRRLPSLSVIIPARNEEANLQKLLPSLNASVYPGDLEIIVVDDASIDRTAHVAHHHAAQVFKLTRLASGWLGKTSACHQGTALAAGEWLLFTDADTVHRPHGLARAVAHAKRMNWDGLSLFLAQNNKGVLDKLALPAAFGGLFAGMDGGTPLLNGQFILIRRAVYDRSGGFAAVRDEPLEDLAFGHLLAKQGFTVPVGRGEDIAEVNMYQNTKQMWQGLARIGAGSMRWMGRGAWVSVGFVAFGLVPFIGVALFFLGQAGVLAFVLPWTIVVLGMLPWMAKFNAVPFVFLSPLGVFIVQLASTWGLVLKTFKRSISWKGRVVGNL